MNEKIEKRAARSASRGRTMCCDQCTRADYWEKPVLGGTCPRKNCQGRVHYYVFLQGKHRMWLTDVLSRHFEAERAERFVDRGLAIGRVPVQDHKHLSPTLERLSRTLRRLQVADRFSLEEVRVAFRSIGGPDLNNSIRMYFLMTCIDRLSQTRDWMSFGDWLRTKNKRRAESIVERTECIQSIIDAMPEVPGEADVRDAGIKLDERYREQFGNNRQFRRYFLSLPSEFRDWLVQSLWVQPTLYKKRNEYGVYPGQAAPNRPSNEWLVRSDTDKLERIVDAITTICRHSVTHSLTMPWDTGAGKLAEMMKDRVGSQLWAKDNSFGVCSVPGISVTDAIEKAVLVGLEELIESACTQVDRLTDADSFESL